MFASDGNGEEKIWLVIGGRFVVIEFLLCENKLENIFEIEFCCARNLIIICMITCDGSKLAL